MYGGFFVEQGLNRAYVDDKVNWIDHVDIDTWSHLWIDDFAYQLNYPRNQIMKVYWLLSVKDLSQMG